MKSLIIRPAETDIRSGITGPSHLEWIINPSQRRPNWGSPSSLQAGLLECTGCSGTRSKLAADTNEVHR
ncbi:MAG: hypothetical protein NDI90_15230 [Nitrospira sp. BO4]|nr:hypothetical protein [Nitrospira sp. BO4]